MCKTSTSVAVLFVAGVLGLACSDQSGLKSGGGHWRLWKRGRGRPGKRRRSGRLGWHHRFRWSLRLARVAPSLPVAFRPTRVAPSLPVESELAEPAEMAPARLERAGVHSHHIRVPIGVREVAVDNHPESRPLRCPIQICGPTPDAGVTKDASGPDTPPGLSTDRVPRAGLRGRVPAEPRSLRLPRLRPDLPCDGGQGGSWRRRASGETSPASCTGAGRALRLLCSQRLRGNCGSLLVRPFHAVLTHPRRASAAGGRFLACAPQAIATCAGAEGSRRGSLPNPRAARPTMGVCAWPSPNASPNALLR